MNNNWSSLLFQDKTGRILRSEEVDELAAWEIEELGIAVYDEDIYE
jgi:hypothetical protein